MTLHASFGREYVPLEPYGEAEVKARLDADYCVPVLGNEADGEDRDGNDNEGGEGAVQKVVAIKKIKIFSAPLLCFIDQVMYGITDYSVSLVEDWEAFMVDRCQAWNTPLAWRLFKQAYKSIDWGQNALWNIASQEEEAAAGDPDSHGRELLRVTGQLEGQSDGQTGRPRPLT